MLISNNWWDLSSILSTPTKRFSLENWSQTLLMHLTKSDSHLSQTLRRLVLTLNQTSRLRSSLIRPTTLLPFKIPVLVWPKRKWSTTLVQLPNQEPKLSWKLLTKVLIFLWLDNSVSDFTLLTWSLIKLQYSLGALKITTNTVGNLQLEVPSLLLMIVRTPSNSLVDPRSFWLLSKITLNSLKREESRISLKSTLNSLVSQLNF